MYRRCPTVTVSDSSMVDILEVAFCPVVPVAGIHEMSWGGGGRSHHESVEQMVVDPFKVELTDESLQRVQGRRRALFVQLFRAEARELFCGHAVERTCALGLEMQRVIFLVEILQQCRYNQLYTDMF